MKLAHVNQDPGIAPASRKGAAVHLDAMRRAFAGQGWGVVAVDEPEDARVRSALEAAGELALVYERYSLRTGAALEHARERGVPYVLEVNAPLEDEERRFRGREAAEGSAACFREATLVLAVSTQVAGYARERGAPAARVLVRPNGVDAERFRPRAALDPLREELVPPGRLALGFHGRARPWHNLPMLARCARRLLDSGEDVQLVLVGEGDFDAVTAELPADRVTRVPWLPHEEVARAVACFDLLPITYAPEAPSYFSPLKLREAMAAGVVPIAPRLGDLPSLLRDGEDALLYEPGALDELVERVVRLAWRPELRGRLAAGARRSAEQHGWSSIARDVLERALSACPEGRA